MNIQPLDDRLLIQVEKEEEKIGSIIIPDTAKEKPRQAVVIAVGTDTELHELIKPGEQILFSKYSGDELKINGQSYLIIQRSDVLAKIGG
jgi:chaperonin GroES